MDSPTYSDESLCNVFPSKLAKNELLDHGTPLGRTPVRGKRSPLHSARRRSESVEVSRTVVEPREQKPPRKSSVIRRGFPARAFDNIEPLRFAQDHSQNSSGDRRTFRHNGLANA